MGPVPEGMELFHPPFDIRYAWIGSGRWFWNPRGRADGLELDSAIPGERGPMFVLSPSYLIGDS